MSESTPEPTHVVSDRLPVGMIAAIGSTWVFERGKHYHVFVLTDEGIWDPITPLPERQSPFPFDEGYSESGYMIWEGLGLSDVQIEARADMGVEREAADLPGFSGLESHYIQAIHDTTGPDPEPECPEFTDTNEHTLDPARWRIDMSDEAVMSSADAAACASAKEKILAAIEAKYECVEGPANAYFRYTLAKDGGAPDPGKPWEVWSEGYTSMRYGAIDGEYGGAFGSRTLSAIVEAIPDWVDQMLDCRNAYVLEHTVKFDTGQKFRVFEPGAERLVWRKKPTVTLRNGRWHCSLRLAFMPKAGVILPPEE